MKLELIGDVIKTARKKRALTQEQLGELIGVKKAHISRLVSGRKHNKFKINSFEFISLFSLSADAKASPKEIKMK